MKRLWPMGLTAAALMAMTLNQATNGQDGLVQIRVTLQELKPEAQAKVSRHFACASGFYRNKVDLEKCYPNFLLFEPFGQDADKASLSKTEELAKKLVSQCGHVREGDIVVLRGGVQDHDLLEDLAVQVRKVGAFPLVTLHSARMTRRLIDDVPAQFDGQKPELRLKLADFIQAEIILESHDLEEALDGLPAQRRAAFDKAEQLVQTRMLERNVRQITLGNGLYPLPSRSKRYGLSEKQLSKLFWEGVNVDYSKLQAVGKDVRKELEGGKEVHITNPNGTDLKFGIKARPIFVSDGMITDEKIKLGGAACQVWLPAGEVFLAPIPGSAEGKVVVDRTYMSNTEVTGLVLTFKAGKLNDMEAKTGLEAVKNAYKAADAGKDDFAFLDIGINPNVKIVEGSKMVAWMPAGMVTVGVGNNTWAGGDNKGAFSLTAFLPRSTLKVDERTLVEKGVLKLK